MRFHRSRRPFSKSGMLWCKGHIMSLKSPASLDHHINEQLALRIFSFKACFQHADGACHGNEPGPKAAWPGFTVDVEGQERSRVARARSFIGPTLAHSGSVACTSKFQVGCSKARPGSFRFLYNNNALMSGICGSNIIPPFSSE